MSEYTEVGISTGTSTGIMDKIRNTVMNPFIIYIILSFITIGVLSYYLNKYMTASASCALEKTTCISEKTTCEQNLTVEKNTDAISTMKEFIEEHISKAKIYQQKMYDIVSTIDSHFKSGADMTQDYLLFTDTKNGNIREDLEPISRTVQNNIKILDVLREINTEESRKLRVKYYKIIELTTLLNGSVNEILNMCVYNQTCESPLEYFKTHVNTYIDKYISPDLPEIQPYP